MEHGEGAVEWLHDFWWSGTQHSEVVREAFVHQTHSAPDAQPALVGGLFRFQRRHLVEYLTMVVVTPASRDSVASVSGKLAQNRIAAFDEMPWRRILRGRFEIEIEKLFENNQQVVQLRGRFSQSVHEVKVNDRFHSKSEHGEQIVAANFNFRSLSSCQNSVCHPLWQCQIGKIYQMQNLKTVNLADCWARDAKGPIKFKTSVQWLCLKVQIVKFTAVRTFSTWKESKWTFGFEICLFVPLL